MTQETSRRIRGSKSGFTLIELLVVVLIIGILAAIAVPQYFKVVEKGKVAEALQWVGTVQGAQESYLAQYGQYAASATLLAVGVQSTFNNFGAPTLDVAGAAINPPTWAVTIPRNSPGPGAYGAYSIEWSGPPGVFVCAGGANPSSCQTDLLPN
jgi:prepilin-type N-terminal cleavage/methylation domain-containing protein